MNSLPGNCFFPSTNIVVTQIYKNPIHTPLKKNVSFLKGKEFEYWTHPYLGNMTLKGVNDAYSSTICNALDFLMILLFRKSPGT